MRTRTKQIVGLVGVTGAVGAAALAGRAANHALAQRIRESVDVDLDPLYELPADVVRHDVPTHDGGLLHVVERGTGRPLVLVHGVTLQAEVWAPLLHLLADRFRVLAVDVRGHGRSVVGDDGIGRHAAASDLATLFEHFDLRDAILTGHSMGGMIIGELCGLYPQTVAERVAGVALMSTAVSLPVPPAAMPVIRRARRRTAARVEAGRRMPRLVGANDRSLVAMRVAFGAKPSGAAVEQTRRLAESVHPDYYLPLWVDLLDYDGEAGLESLEVPTLVLVGSRDRLTPVSMARRIVGHLPHGELHLLDGAGHQLMQERPREIAELVTELDDRLSAAEPRVASVRP